MNGSRCLTVFSEPSNQVTNQPTNYMDQSPSCEAVTQKIPRPLRNPKVHYRVKKIPPMFPVLSQMHPVHTFPPYFNNIHCNITFSSTPRSFWWSLSFMSFWPKFCILPRVLSQNFLFH